jgi:hypothetical protein
VCRWGWTNNKAALNESCVCKILWFCKLCGTYTIKTSNFYIQMVKCATHHLELCLIRHPHLNLTEQVLLHFLYARSWLHNATASLHRTLYSFSCFCFCCMRNWNTQLTMETTKFKYRTNTSHTMVTPIMEEQIMWFVHEVNPSSLCEHLVIDMHSLSLTSRSAPYLPLLN